MKKMKDQLKSVSKSLVSLAKQVDKLTTQVDKLQSAKKAAPKRSSAKRKVAAKKITAKKTVSAKSTTVLASVLNVIKRSRKGVTIAVLKSKTGLDSRQLSNALYKLSKKGMVRTESRGVYVST